MGASKTGSGKTIAYLIPVIERVINISLIYFLEDKYRSKYW